MYALISSTIFPVPALDGVPRSVFTPEQRLEQTKKTIESISQLGFERIILVDNSADRWVTGLDLELRPAIVKVVDMHQFNNRGISEAWTLVRALDWITDSEAPILKISGRYTLSSNLLSQLDTADIVGRISSGSNTFSTRAYGVRNKQVYLTFLLELLREIYAYPSRIVGPRSLMRIVCHSLTKRAGTFEYQDPDRSIEQAATHVLQQGQFTLKKVDALHVEGILGPYGTHISE